MTAVESRLRDALFAGVAAAEESPDLFARIQLSIEDDRRHRRQQRRALGIAACVVGAVLAIVFATTERRQGEFLMDWWVLELLTDAVLIGMALWLGPLIKRFGKSYAADVFRAQSAHRQELHRAHRHRVLPDLHLLHHVHDAVRARRELGQTVNAAQLQHETARVAGILLIIGMLHGLNLLALPVMGRLLTLNRQLDESTPPSPA